MIWLNFVIFIILLADHTLNLWLLDRNFHIIDSILSNDQEPVTKNMINFLNFGVVNFDTIIKHIDCSRIDVEWKDLYLLEVRD